MLDSQSKRPIGNINAASNRAEPQAVTTEFEYSEPWWDDYHGKWMCSVSELNTAAKRQRPDDGVDEMDTKEPEEKQPKSQSKSEGKGKSSGPRTKPVCCNCGEPGHFCTQPTGKGKGKNWIPASQWIQHNPGSGGQVTTRHGNGGRRLQSFFSALGRQNKQWPWRGLELGRREPLQVPTKRFREAQKEENCQICEVRVPVRAAPGHDVQQICHVER